MPGNSARNLPAIAGSVLVFDRATGAHLALIDGAVATARRTAAASALGARDLTQAVPQADIISAATLATEPLLMGEWLQPGQHVDLIGAFTPAMREADDRALQPARLFVDTRFAAIEAGELKTPLETGAIAQSDILGDLYALAQGKAMRGSKDEITLFKSVGNAVMDLAAAITATRTAKEEPHV